MTKKEGWEDVVPGKSGAIIQILEVFAPDSYLEDGVEGSVFLVSRKSRKMIWSDSKTCAVEGIELLKGNGFLGSLQGDIVHFHSCTFRVLFSW